MVYKHTQKKKQPNKILHLDTTKFRLTLFFIYCTLLKKNKKKTKNIFKHLSFFVLFFFFEILQKKKSRLGRMSIFTMLTFTFLRVRQRAAPRLLPRSLYVKRGHWQRTL